jgi:hypothetical protein
MVRALRRLATVATPRVRNSAKVENLIYKTREGILVGLRSKFRASENVGNPVQNATSSFGEGLRS